MTARRQRLVVLGATGSIGVNTLDVVARHPDRFEVLALSAQNRVERLADQCARFKPRFAVVGSDAAADQLGKLLRQSGCETTVLAGAEALERISSLAEADAVMAAIVGAAGLRCGYQAATASAAHCAPRSAWQPLQAFGVPSDTLRSGRGMRSEWSWRGSMTM